MNLTITNEDIKSIYYHNLNLIIVLESNPMGIKKINLLFESNLDMLEQVNDLITKNELMLDDEFLCRKYIRRNNLTLEEQ